jgi:hypothetical protein
MGFFNQILITNSRKYVLKPISKPKSKKEINIPAGYRKINLWIF